MRHLGLTLLLVVFAILGSAACGYGGAPSGGNPPGASSTPGY